MFSRSSVGKIRQGIREGKEMAILINSIFLAWEFFGRSLVRLWFIIGIWQGRDKEGTREGNLNFRYKL